MAVELRVLGSAHLVAADGRVLHTVLAQPKRLALLAFLAADRHSVAHRRDKLLALLWPELPEDKARNALSQALSFLRRALGEASIVSSGVDALVVDRAVVSCDAVALLDAAARRDHERVVERFRGEFLEGLHVDGAPAFDRWLEAERRYLRDLAVASCRALSVQRRGEGDAAGAMRWAERAVTLAPHDAAVVQDLMHLHRHAGNASAALGAYDAYAKRLRAELDVEPDASLVTFAESLGTKPAAAEPVDLPVRHVDVHDTPSRSQSAATLPIVHRRIAIAVLSTLAVVALVASVRWASGSSNVRQRIRFAIALDDSARIPPEASGISLALSPDGTELLYVGGFGASRIFRRQFEDFTARPIPGTENARNPSFSPDGKWLAFKAGNVLMRMPVRGGPMVTITDSVQRYSWGDGGVIVFDRTLVHASRSLWQMNADGGSPRLLTAVDSVRGESVHTWPHVLPGGKVALFTIESTGGPPTSELAAIRLADRRIVRLGIKGLNPRYVPNGAKGFIVFGRFNGTVYAAPFDATRLRVMGREIPVLEDVVVKVGGAMDLNISPDGTLAYARFATARQLVVIDRDGHERTLVADRRRYSQPRFSPDAKRIAVVIQDGGTTDVWIADVASGALTRLTSSGIADRPEWSAGGQLIYWRETAGVHAWIRSQATDGMGVPTTFADSTQTLLVAPTGRFFAAIPARYGPQVGVVTLDPRTPRAKVPLVDERDSPVMARISPDGKWIAFAGGLAGQRELFVQPIPPTGARHRISSVGSSDPVWGADSRELFYRAGGKMIRASLDLASDASVTRRDTLFDDTFWHSDNSRFADYDVSRDGKQIVAVGVSGEQVRVTVVVGWADELRERFGRR